MNSRSKADFLSDGAALKAISEHFKLPTPLPVLPLSNNYSVGSLIDLMRVEHGMDGSFTQDRTPEGVALLEYGAQACWEIFIYHPQANPSFTVRSLVTYSAQVGNQWAEYLGFGIWEGEHHEV